MASVSPGFKLWMYTDARPFGYFFTRNVNSPGASEADIGVYGLITGLPFSFFNASGSDDLKTTQDATGRSDAWLSGSSNTNLRS